MNRDTTATAGQIIAQAGRLVNAVLDAAETGDLPTGMATAATTIREILAKLWPDTSPAAARDTILYAARIAFSDPASGPAGRRVTALAIAGWRITGDPDASDLATILLTLAQENRWQAARTVVSLLTSDPARDDLTLTTLAALLAVAVTPAGDGPQTAVAAYDPTGAGPLPPALTWEPTQTGWWAHGVTSDYLIIREPTQTGRRLIFTHYHRPSAGTGVQVAAAAALNAVEVTSPGQGRDLAEQTETSPEGTTH